MSIDYLLDKSDVRKAEIPKVVVKTDEFIKLPVLNLIRENDVVYATDNIVNYKYVAVDELPEGEYFYLEVLDDSMDLCRFTKGDSVLVRRQEEVEDGDIAVIAVEGEEAVIRKFYREDKLITLMPYSSSSSYYPRVIDNKIQSLKVIGKVIGAHIQV